MHGKDFISHLAENLDRFRVHYYTCHCTGELAYLEMKKRLKGNLDYVAAGGQIQITDNGSYLKNPKEFSQKDLYAMIVFDTDNCGCFTAGKLSD